MSTVIPAADRWGPFAPDLDEPERRARLRSLRALVRVHCGPRAGDLPRLLHEAETDPAVLHSALAALDRLTASDRRHVLASYAALARSAA